VWFDPCRRAAVLPCRRAAVLPCCRAAALPYCRAVLRCAAGLLSNTHSASLLVRRTRDQSTHAYTRVHDSDAQCSMAQRAAVQRGSIAAWHQHVSATARYEPDHTRQDQIRPDQITQSLDAPLASLISYATHILFHIKRNNIIYCIVLYCVVCWLVGGWVEEWSVGSGRVECRAVGVGLGRVLAGWFAAGWGRSSAAFAGGGGFGGFVFSLSRI
jgi:hypothetical protein